MDFYASVIPSVTPHLLRSIPPVLPHSSHPIAHPSVVCVCPTFLLSLGPPNASCSLRSSVVLSVRLSRVLQTSAPIQRKTIIKASHLLAIFKFYSYLSVRIVFLIQGNYIYPDDVCSVKIHLGPSDEQLTTRGNDIALSSHGLHFLFMTQPRPVVITRLSSVSQVAFPPQQLPPSLSLAL